MAHTLAPRLDVDTLTTSQRERVSCIHCDEATGRLNPVDVEGAWLLEHPYCAAGGVTNGVIAVIGDTSTPEALEATCAAGMDVADKLRQPARILVGLDHDIRAYEGAVILDTYLDSVASAGLAFEAQAADMMAVHYSEIMFFPIDLECGWCGEEDETAEPRHIGDEWTQSLCEGCWTHMVRDAQ
ncbi:hypothetical protein C5L38_12935 [Streptomyces sp. WAC00288]|uniref:hypothetical protein n=1 Tax=unclassified Streptomyces TaxID=2593676 RepID=UPI0007888BFF|nr:MULTISPECIES: hypothetical protein [unclassified Streptomyces]AVH95869.1 hypothetical protein C5L38_12935 [Streptomyces sp. WAC00288]KYG54532.1 hypothetical protein AWI43_08750 [Streptomyces sp. WAC04657]